MRYRGTELVVGAFVLAGVAIVIFGIFTIRGFGFGGTVGYHALYQNVSTVEVGTPVKYNGMLVGRVTDIQIDVQDRSRIRVDFQVAEATPITRDLVAKITKADLLGDEYIDLRVQGAEPGTAESRAVGTEPVPPGGRVAAGEPFDLQRALERLQGVIGRIDALLESASRDVETALATLNDMLGDARRVLSEENLERVRSTLETLSDTATDLRAMLADNRSGIDAVISSAGEATSNLRDLTVDLKDTMATVGPRLEDLSGSMSSAVDELETALAGVSSTLDSLDVHQVNDLLDNLDTASRNLAEFTREIRERPYRLIRKEQPRQEGQR